jgi:hypothetical protein
VTCADRSNRKVDTMQNPNLWGAGVIVLSAILGIVGASAADLPVAADLPIKALPPVVSGWNGFYIGGGLGTRSSVIDSSITSATIGTPPIPANGVNNANCISFFGPAGCANGANLDSTAFRCRLCQQDAVTQRQPVPGHYHGRHPILSIGQHCRQFLCR